MGAFLDNAGLTTLVQLIKGSLPTKATSSTVGLVKPDNSTITVDSDGVISSSGGGTTYTAGSGINIDANNVISKKNPATPLFVLLWHIMTGTETGQYNQTAGIGIANNGAPLEKVNTATHIANLKAYGMTMTTDGTSTSFMESIVVAMGDNVSNTFYYVSAEGNMNSQYTKSWGTSSSSVNNYMVFGMNTDPTLIIFNPEQAYGSNYRWYIIKTPWKLFQNGYFNSQQGLTSHSIASAIDEVAQRTKAPTTDGNYVLKCSVSSGTPTYSWVSET